EHARDMTPALLAAVLGATLGDDGTHVLAGHRAPRVGKREEPDVVGRGDAAGVGERDADRREDGTAIREDLYDVELRRLAHAGERPDAAQEPAREESPRAVDAREQRRDRRVRLARA